MAKILLFLFVHTDKRDEPEAKSVAANQIDSADSSRGFRSISVSNDGHYLAAGDRGGNLHIYDLNSLQMAYFKVILSLTHPVFFSLGLLHDKSVGK